MTESAYRGPMARLGGPPEKVADAIAQALAAPRPKARYPVTASARVMITLRRLVPDRAWDAMMRMSFPTPRA